MSSLRVLTLNVWGLHYVAIQIRERLGYIVNELHEYDIVALQEVWSKRDYSFLIDKLRDTLPFTHYFHSGVVGSGLCVFSKHPIMTAHTHSFSVTGGVSELKDGEVFAAKGIMLCKIRTPSGAISIYNTHLNPKFRESQLFEVVQFVEQTRGNDPVILLGDFNTKTRHLAYSLMTKCLRMKDAFIDNPVDTCDRTSNIYSDTKRMTPKRIDFIFYCDEFSSTHTLELMNKKLALSGEIPGKSFPYSDHEGVEATIELERRDKPINIPERVFDDGAVKILMEISSSIEQKKIKYHTTVYQTSFQWTLMLIICPLLGILFSSTSLHNFLIPYYLHWLPMLFMMLVVALSILKVVTDFSRLHMVNALEANLFEIQTLLQYNGILRSSDGRNNHHCSS